MMGTHYTRTRLSSIIGCAVIGSFGILLLDALIFKSNIYYYSDNILVLYPTATHDLLISLTIFLRPIEYFILLGANEIYLPLWLGVSLLCTVAAMILSALTCEIVFDRELPRAGWWVLGLANPLLFYATSQATVLSQPLSNLLFACCMFAFVVEWRRLPSPLRCGWRADRVAVFLNFTAAAMFFTKETAVAAAVVIPAATTLMRLKAGRLSPIFLFSLLLPIIAATSWILLKLKFLSLGPRAIGAGRYDVKANPIEWFQNVLVTLAFPITPLPTSFIGFDALRQVWIVVALGSVILFMGLLLRETRRQPRIVLPLLIVGASLAPMILIHASELYATMIAPLAVSMVLLFGLVQMPRLTLAYGLMLYAASLGNALIYSFGPDFSLLGRQKLAYSIYGAEYQFFPMCPIRTTAHVAWDENAANDLPFPPGVPPGVKGRIICIR
jgi:hypothetical protein